MNLLQKKLEMPSADQALKGRPAPIDLVNSHFVHGRPIKPPFSDNDSALAKVAFGLGCFWGAERAFWSLPGVHSTAVGYGAGYTPNPTYEEVCSGMTGHNELVLIVYQPTTISFTELLKVFFDSHNPTQGMRQGNDKGTQYRSGIYLLESDHTQTKLAQTALDAYQQQLALAGYSKITTEIKELDEFYYAEQYHQQYLAKNPNGYCGLGGTGIECSLSKE